MRWLPRTGQWSEPLNQGAAYRSQRKITQSTAYLEWLVRWLPQTVLLVSGLSTVERFSVGYGKRFCW